VTSRLTEGGVARRAYLIHGEDPGLVSQELSALTEELRALDPGGLDVVEEYGEPGRDEAIELGEILNACRTTPFFSTLRVVVVRDAKALDAAQQREVVAYLDDPVDTSVLVLASTGGRPPKRLLDAVGKVGTVISAFAGTNVRDRTKWVSDHLKGSGVHLDAAATARVAEHLGEDLSRLESISGALSSAYGTGSLLRVEEIEPFLGEAGSVAPWDLTDAIDASDLPRAIDVLHRMLDAGERHPLQILASLNRHVGAMLRLDGEGSITEQGAAAATGLAPYPAKKALQQSRKLGHDKLVTMVSLLAEADLDLRGRIGWPPELVVEVLVGRLARLAPKVRARTR
jgi:DNA polymerase-3 subunit delta